MLTQVGPQAASGGSARGDHGTSPPQLADLTHLKISVEEVPRVSGGGFRSSPVQYNLRGATWINWSPCRQRWPSGCGGARDRRCEFDLRRRQAGVEVIVDRDKAADLGVSVDELGRAVRALIGGQEASTFEEDGETFDVRVRLAEHQRSGPADVLAVPCGPAAANWSSCGTWSNPQRHRPRADRPAGPHAASHHDGQPEVRQGAGRGAGGRPPPGSRDRLAGRSDVRHYRCRRLDGRVLRQNIGFSMLLAVVLIYMVLAAQFESLVHPFTVMLSLPLSVVGALGPAG
jgi:hydrophobic/amphiphilic exporter-1 (mainly G- bacteria), HAE1 family